MPTESPGGSSFENYAAHVQFRALKASKQLQNLLLNYNYTDETDGIREKIHVTLCSLDRWRSQSLSNKIILFL